jgi:hypothetical protein
MSQISPPIRILLVAFIGLVAVYMLFLRPKPVEAGPAAAPTAATPVPAKDPGAATSSGSGAIVQSAVEKTTDAAAQAKVAAGENPGGLADDGTVATGTTAATGTTPAGTQTGATAAISTQTLASLPKDVRRAVRKHKVIALLFYNNRSSDDRAVRRALAKVDRYGGQVFVDAHWIKSVAKYQAITRGVDVEQSPTIVIADRNLKAETLVGYANIETINQAVVDAILASGGSLLKNPYFRKIDTVCNTAKTEAKALAAPAGAAAMPSYLDGVQQVAVNMKARAAAIKPGKSHRAFHKAFVGYSAGNVAIVEGAQIALKTNPAKGAAVVKYTATQGKALDKLFVAAHGAHGLSCF